MVTVKLSSLIQDLEFEVEEHTGVSLIVYEVYWPDLAEGPDHNYLYLRRQDAEQVAEQEREVRGLIRVRNVY